VEVTSHGYKKSIEFIIRCLSTSQLRNSQWSPYEYVEWLQRGNYHFILGHAHQSIPQWNGALWFSAGICTFEGYKPFRFSVWSMVKLSYPFTRFLVISLAPLIFPSHPCYFPQNLVISLTPLLLLFPSHPYYCYIGTDVFPSHPWDCYFPRTLVISLAPLLFTSYPCYFIRTTLIISLATLFFN